MHRKLKPKSAMLEWAKVIHEAIGIENPKVFITLFALLGFLVFGTIGWIIDKGYRARLRQQFETHSSAAPTNPQPSLQNTTYGPQSPIMPNNSGTVIISDEPPKGGSRPAKKESKQNGKKVEPNKDP